MAISLEALVKSIELEPGKVDAEGNSHLHLLATIPSPGKGQDLVASLIKETVDPNLANKAGDTPLHLAARAGSNEVCQALLDGGADPLKRNAKNRRPREVPKVPEATKQLLLDAEEDAKQRKAARDSALWDEKMLATQTQSACGVGVL